MKRKIKLSLRQFFDLELLLNGAFFPLDGFLSQENYESVLDNLRLKTGEVWPMPVVLDVSMVEQNSIEIGEEVHLTDQEGLPIAMMVVCDKWKPDKHHEAKKVFGTSDEAHPGVNYLMNEAGDYYLGGKVSPLSPIKHFDFVRYRQTPSRLKSQFNQKGWKKIIGFQTRNPMHRAHIELTLRAATEHKANLLIQPVVGMTKPGDIDHYTRVKCYQKVIEQYPDSLAELNLLPLAMRMAGPREALWHAVIRKNYGCTHFIVGRDHAGPGQDSTGTPFYGPYDAQELVKKYENDIGIEMIPFQEMVYVKERCAYQTRTEMTHGHTAMRVSGTDFRRMLAQGTDIPDWFSYSSVINQLKSVSPSLDKRGFCVFFTGLSGAGKSTLAKALIARLHEVLDRPITLLDGDLVRNNLSSELNFSKEHRDINIKRIGYVASEIVKHHGIAICAPIAPYDDVRKKVRSMVSQYGGFFLIHVSTILPVCEKRDTKGLYYLARAGKISGFTGIDDPYELPTDSDLVVNTEKSVSHCVDMILNTLIDSGYLNRLLFTQTSDELIYDPAEV